MYKKITKLFLICLISLKLKASPIFEICDLSLDQINHISQLQSGMEGSLISPEHLKLLKISHYNFQGEVKCDGQVIVHQVAASNLINIFKNLFEIKFPINSLILIDEFGDNNSRSMDANNSFAFYVQSGDSYSTVHSYGLAIDLNPVQNPVVNYSERKSFAEIFPVAGVDYFERDKYQPGMITSNVVDIFRQNGFTVWSGMSDVVTTDQHFQVPAIINDIIVKTSVNLISDAQRIFLIYVDFLNNRKEDFEKNICHFLAILREACRNIHNQKIIADIALNLQDIPFEQKTCNVLFFK